MASKDIDFLMKKLHNMEKMLDKDDIEATKYTKDNLELPSFNIQIENEKQYFDETDNKKDEANKYLLDKEKNKKNKKSN